MGPTLVTLIVALLGVTAGFPADDEVVQKQGLQRPITPEPPKISECALEALLNEEFGRPGNVNCSKPTPVQPIDLGTASPPSLGQLSNTEKGEKEIPKPNLDGYECTSVDYVRVPCNKNNQEFDDPIDVRVVLPDEDCFQYLTTCCRIETGSKTPSTDERIGSTSPKTTETTSTSTTMKPVEPEPQPTPRSGQCGVRNTGGVKTDSTVIGWREGALNATNSLAKYGEFPWMVAIFRLDEVGAVYQCGGSLVHPQVVLTAAHCVRGLNKDKLSVAAGEWDMDSNDEPYPAQDRRVQEVIFHEEFNNATLANGLALLVLETAVDTGVETAGVICLPEPSEDMDGRQCVATGWGKDSLDDTAEYKDILKKVDLPIVPRAPCLQALYKTRLGPYYKLHETFLCAGGVPGKDTCKGDGGGPLVCPSRSNPSVYVQAGIVVMGIECNTETPGLYVNVARYVDWLDSTLRARGFNISNVSSNVGLQRLI